MGYYIDPPAEPKEDWLARVGKQIPSPTWPPAPEMALVCLIDNIRFTAALICVSMREVRDGLETSRNKTWWLVPKSALGEASAVPQEAWE